MKRRVAQLQCISSSNPWRWYVQRGKDMRKKGREAPSTDLGDWMEGKVFLDCIVEEQRADDALVGGANEEEWRAVWREERVEMGETRGVRKDKNWHMIVSFVFMYLEGQLCSDIKQICICDLINLIKIILATIQCYIDCWEICIFKIPPVFIFTIIR